MEFKTSNKNIIYLDWNNKEHINAVVNLHLNLLPESILSKLGFLFLSKFYYSKLPKKKLIEVYLYKHGEEYVGFISCTNEPFAFMKQGQKENFLLISVLLGMSIIIKPKRLGLLLNMKNDLPVDFLQKEYGSEIGQFLSFGVLENYRKIIDPLEGVSIPNVLMKLVTKHFKTNKKNYFFLLVLKSNLKVIRFYERYMGAILPSNDDYESIVVKFDI